MTALAGCTRTDVINTLRKMRIEPAPGHAMRRCVRCLDRTRSAEAEVTQDEQDNDYRADEPDDVVHDSAPLPTLNGTMRVLLTHGKLAPQK